MDFNVPQRTLTDIRDGETYRVRKLADGNVWMTENLRLVFSGNYVGKYDSSNNTITATTTQITPENSDVSTTWAPGNTTETSITKTQWQAGTASTEAEANAVHSYRENMTLTDGDSLTQSIGTHYSWNALTAGTGLYSMVSYQVASESICPKGFKLPGIRGRGGDGWMELLIKMYSYYYGGVAARTDEASRAETVTELNSMLRFPLSLIRSGLYYSGALLMFNIGGYYGTKTAYGADDNYGTTYILLLRTDSGPWPQYNASGGASKAAGMTVRCLVKSN